MLADPIHFLYTMEHFRKEDITEEMVNKLKDYIENPNFEPAKVHICLHLYYNKLHLSDHLSSFHIKYLISKI